MLTGDIQNQIDAIWNAFAAGGISNPLEVIEQITYLLFTRRLDDLHTLEESKATRIGKPIENAVFPKGKDDHPRNPRPYSDLRWSHFKNFAPAGMTHEESLADYPDLEPEDLLACLEYAAKLSRVKSSVRTVA